MNIYLYHPSRGRPEQAADAFYTWKGRASGKVHHILSVDADDEKLNEYHHYFLVHGTPSINDNRTMVEALNRCLSDDHEGIVVTLYDDMVPSEGWDEALLKAYQPGKLFRVDCGEPLQTVCAGCASVFHQWGYVYYPGYVSMFADNDYQEHGEQEGLFVDCEMKVTHNHPAHGTAETDATYERQNHGSAYNLGSKVLARRRWSQFAF